MERFLFVVGFVAFWTLALMLMYIGWRGRARRQAHQIGQLPATPVDLGEQIVAPTTGLYVGSTIAPSWQDRIAVGDLGFRATGELSQYDAGILLERDGGSTLWIPQESVRAVRTERGLAGKVMSKDGVLVIRWQLPSGTEIDTGFRGDDKSVYPVWVQGLADATNGGDSLNAASSGEVERVTKNA
ncbi:PH-like domain-containing protein [Rhodococcus opacus]|uniref:Transporter n=1 Tax=Rhodococcus opacus TaxID=37919 RepID=A0A076EZ37_RHOOP|nr:transporter [Rhodococcus opacus]AII11230.1 transporter [Rhodococcus opacus]